MEEWPASHAGDWLSLQANRAALNRGPFCGIFLRFAGDSTVPTKEMSDEALVESVRDRLWRRIQCFCRRINVPLAASLFHMHVYFLNSQAETAHNKNLFIINF